MNDIKGIYNAAIHPGRINIYYEPLQRPGSHKHSITDSEHMDKPTYVVPVQFKNNSHNGKLSKIAIGKITRAVSYLVYLVPRRKYFTTADGRAGNYFLSFITLTLSSQQIHSDNEIKSGILEPFLNEMRKRWKVSNYIWRAEKQENGNIHFHIVSDRFVWWNDVRNSWNYYQERFGYVTRYREHQKSWHQHGFKYRPELSKKWDRMAQYKAYQSGLRNDWNSPNSTDIHSLKTITSVRSYICKYITKSEQSQDISGRLWGCSYELTNLKGSVEFASGSISDELDKLMASDQVKIYKGDYYTAIFFDHNLLHKLKLFKIIQSFDVYIHQQFPDYHSPDLFKLAA